jgi:peroxiredoxin
VGAELTTELGLLKDYGEYGRLAQRVTFLLDGDGVVQRVWDVDDAAAHPEEVLAAVGE